MRSPNPRSLLLVVLMLATSTRLTAQAPSQTAWKTLQDGVNEKSPERRSRAVRALGLLPGNHQAIVLAEGALQDEKPQVRVAAATALGEMLSRASIPKLNHALSDKDSSVVLAAAQSLVALKDDRGYDIYYTVLTGQRKTGKGLVSEGLNLLQNRKKLAELGIEGGIGFIPFGGLGVTAFSVLSRDDVSPVRAAAAQVLAKDRDPQSGEALGEAVSDKSAMVRAAALEAIAKRGDPALLSDVEPAMSDGDDLVRYTAAAALIRLMTLRQGTR